MKDHAASAGDQARERRRSLGSLVERMNEIVA
jgi:hypothetical protein